MYNTDCNSYEPIKTTKWLESRQPALKKIAWRTGSRTGRDIIDDMHADVGTRGQRGQW